MSITTANGTTTRFWVQLAETRKVLAVCSETGNEYWIEFQAGRTVLTDDEGIARPTIHGGGVHRTVFDVEHGIEFSAVTNGHVGRVTA